MITLPTIYGCIAYGLSAITGLLLGIYTYYCSPTRMKLCALHLWTFLSQFLALIGLMVIDLSSPENGERLRLCGVFLMQLQLLAIGLTAVDILQIFCVLDHRITEFSLKAMRIFMVVAFFGFGSLNLATTVYRVVTSIIPDLVVLAERINAGFPVILVTYESILAIYLIRLLYKLRKRTIDKTDLNSAIILIVLIRFIDVVAIFLFIVKGLVIAQNHIGNSIVGIHSSALGYLFFNLKNMAITPKQREMIKKQSKAVIKSKNSSKSRNLNKLNAATKRETSSIPE